MSRRNPSRPNQLLYRVDGSFTRSCKWAYTPDPCAPLFNHAQLCLRGAIMPIGTTRFGRGVAVPTAINIAFPPTLNDGATVPTRVSPPTYFSMIQPATSRTTEMLPRFVCAKISPSPIRFITVKTGKRNHAAPVRPTCETRPRHSTTINFDGQSGRFIAPLGVAGATAHRHGRSSPCMSMLRATEKPTCFRMLDTSCLGIEHVRALRQRADPHFTASDVRMRRPPRLLCSTRTAQFLMQSRGLVIAYLPLATFARKHRATPGITTFGRYKRTVPILALSVMCIYSTAPLHRDKDVQTGTIWADTRYLNTPLLATHLLGHFYPRGANIVQDTLVRTVMPHVGVLPHMKGLTARAAYPRARGVSTDQAAVFFISGGGKWHTAALTRTLAGHNRTLAAHLGFALYFLRLAIAFAALRMPLRSHTTAPNRNKFMGTGTLRPSAADLNTTALTTRTRRRLHPSQTVRFLATRVGTVCTRTLRHTTRLKDTPALRTWSFPFSLPALDRAVPLQGPRNRERCSTAVAGAYQNQLSPIWVYQNQLYSSISNGKVLSWAQARKK